MRRPDGTFGWQVDSRIGDDGTLCGEPGSDGLVQVDWDLR